MIPTALWPHYSLSKTLSSFASSKVACELPQHLTVKPGGWNSTHGQLGPRDIQPFPVFLSLFSNQVYKAKSLKKHMGDCSSLKAFESPSSIWSIKEGTHSPASRVVSHLSLPQSGVPWGNIRHLSKLHEHWEENASHCECNFMLSSHPKVYVVWMRSRSSGILSWEWVSHHLHDCLPGSLQLGLPHCA